MISDWKFRIAVCLIISTYVIGINADGEGSHGPTGQEFNFLANKTVKGDDKKHQIECGPKELCDKAKIQVITCTGNLTSPIENRTSTTDYKCEPKDVKLEDQKLELVTYKVHSLPDEKDVTNENSWVEITLKEANPQGGGANVGLIIGIVVLVIAVLIGVVALLGYKGIGPLKSFFNN